MDVFTPAFTLWGVTSTWLEIIALLLALAMVVCNIRELHWGWPLAMLSSLLYCALFWKSKLYGDASLQIFFALIAAWGWAQWLRAGPRNASAKPLAVPPQTAALRVQTLSTMQRRWSLVACALLWPATGLFLKTYTDTDVPWWDAFPTSLSVVAQLLLGRKYIENWLLWIAVNLVSVGLFAYKGLWLTALLYGVFVLMSVQGWRVWKQSLRH